MTELEIYFNNTQSPWGKLFYKAIWEQLNFARELKILDFGSGFGITSNHLADCNEVIAIEPNNQMILMRIQENNYTQINGSVELLDDFKDEEFDLIICHNVLEYIDDKEKYMKSFARLLKAGGRLSLVKHNHCGRILQRVAHDNDIELALKLVNNEPAIAQNFGEIKYYDNKKLSQWSELFDFKILEQYGVRTFFALHSDDTRYNEDWIRQIHELETKVSQIDEFRNIAFFNHLIFEKL